MERVLEKSVFKNLIAKRTRYVILLLTIFVTIHVFTNTTENISPLNTIKSISNISDPLCRLSMKESDGWFCETDTSWLRRKKLHRIQDKRNRASDDRSLFFQNNWEPTIQCEFERRLGNIGDGGKWVCNIHRFLEISPGRQLVYSFGSHGDFSFERAIKQELPDAEIHTFDMGTYQCPPEVCIFHQVKLGKSTNAGSKSLQAVIDELGHASRTIDILKVDIEGSEFDLFEEFFARSKTIKPTYIRQILFEIHLFNVQNEDVISKSHRLFETFRKKNYVIFHKEVNLFDPHNVFEYSLLRMNRHFFKMAA